MREVTTTGILRRTENPPGDWETLPPEAYYFCRADGCEARAEWFRRWPAVVQKFDHNANDWRDVTDACGNPLHADIMEPACAEHAGKAAPADTPVEVTNRAD